MNIYSREKTENMTKTIFINKQLIFHFICASATQVIPSTAKWRSERINFTWNPTRILYWTDWFNLRNVHWKSYPLNALKHQLTSTYDCFSHNPIPVIHLANRFSLSNFLWITNLNSARKHQITSSMDFSRNPTPVMHSTTNKYSLNVIYSATSIN